jgi:aminoglycoside phosphotransferase (APT) family kinase protein
VASLLAYLRGHLGEGVGFAEEPIALSGGFETAIYAFRLTGAPPEFTGSLILRLYPAFVDAARATYEKVVHETLVAGGYPAPRVLLACADTETLGGGFLVMERLPGEPLAEDFFQLSTILHLKTRAFGFVSRSMAQLHLQLHAVDGSRLLQALSAEGLPDSAPPYRVSTRLASFDGRLDQLASRAQAVDLAGLAAGLEWALKHSPNEHEEVLCHGDFHPLNIMSDRGDISGVIDWSLATMASPAFDVGNTLMILGLASGVGGGPASALRRSTAKRYLSHYQKVRPLEMDAVRYYEAYRCLQSLVWAAENRIVRTKQPEVRPVPWDAPEVSGGLVTRFQEISGVSVSP